MQKPPGRIKTVSSPLPAIRRSALLLFLYPSCSLVLGNWRLLAAYEVALLSRLCCGAGSWILAGDPHGFGALTTTKMNDAEHLDGAAEACRRSFGGISSGEARLAKRHLSNASFPACCAIFWWSASAARTMFWYDRWAGAIGLPWGGRFLREFPLADARVESLAIAS